MNHMEQVTSAGGAANREVGQLVHENNTASTGVQTEGANAAETNQSNSPQEYLMIPVGGGFAYWLVSLCTAYRLKEWHNVSRLVFEGFDFLHEEATDEDNDDGNEKREFQHMFENLVQHSLAVELENMSDEERSIWERGYLVGYTNGRKRGRIIWAIAQEAADRRHREKYRASQAAAQTASQAAVAEPAVVVQGHDIVVGEEGTLDALPSLTNDYGDPQDYDFE